MRKRGQERVSVQKREKERERESLRERV